MIHSILNKIMLLMLVSGKNKLNCLYQTYILLDKKGQLFMSWFGCRFFTLLQNIKTTTT